MRKSQEEKEYNRFLEEFLKEKREELGRIIDDEFIKQKNEIKEGVLAELKSYLSPVPTHFVWEDDGCPYDHSGIIVEDGVVDLEQTVEDFLMFEYTGTKRPTFVSGSGWHYETYGDFVSQYTFEIGSDIISEKIKGFIEEHFKAALPEKLSKFYDHDAVFDCIYDDLYYECFDCVGWKFSYYEMVFEFLGIDIGNMVLSDFVG